jgi:hypothetical protein
MGQCAAYAAAGWQDWNRDRARMYEGLYCTGGKMNISLDTPTRTIINEIEVLKLTQKDVALTYALAIFNSMSEVDWSAVNKSIANRWSPSARERIKKIAWKLVDQWKREAMK